MTCQECGDESDELETLRAGGRKRRLCPDCADVARQEAEIAGDAEDAMRGMMEYKGRR